MQSTTLDSDTQKKPQKTPHRLSWISIVLTHWNNSLRVYMSLHSDTLFWFQANQSLLLLLSAVCLAEKQQILIL